MTTEQYIANQRRWMAQIIDKDIPLQRAVRDTMAKQVTRIFVEGKKSDGSQIGQYDTKRSMYINPNTSPRKTGDKVKGIEGLLPPKGKHGDETFKSGKKHKTTYVNNYKDFRNRIGRRIDTVDLFLSGDLKSDMSNSKSEVKPIQINTHEYVTGLKRPENVEKLAGNEKKFGDIAPLTSDEQANFFRVANKELQLIINA